MELCTVEKQLRPSEGFMLIVAGTFKGKIRRQQRENSRKISGKQARYQKDTNHLISKRIVQNAQDTGRAIALEDLGGIRDRVNG